MIAEFLRAEIDSPRHGGRLLRIAAEQGVDLGVIRNPVTASAVQNAVRRQVLVDHAGWGRYESVFGGLPTEAATWREGRLAREALDAVEVIRWLVDEYPDSFPSRSLGDIRQARQIGLGGGLPSAAQEMAAALSAGRAPPRPIVISTPDLQRIVILEGHNRMAAYDFLGPEGPPLIDLVVGLTDQAACWSEW